MMQQTLTNSNCLIILSKKITIEFKDEEWNGPDLFDSHYLTGVFPLGKIPGPHPWLKYLFSF